MTVITGDPPFLQKIIFSEDVFPLHHGNPESCIIQGEWADCVPFSGANHLPQHVSQPEKNSRGDFLLLLPVSTENTVDA